MKVVERKYLRRMRLLGAPTKDDTAKFDTEEIHEQADEMLIELLREIGFSDLADEYEALPKWYS